MTAALDQIAALARHLPASSLQALSLAIGDGTAGLKHLRSQSTTNAARHACDQLITHLDDGAHPMFLAGALAAAGHAEQQRHQSSVEVVWTGPDSGHTGTRLTLAVITDLIASAERELLLVSYAAHSDPNLVHALEVAHARGIDITLLLERPEDNPAYESYRTPFESVAADRLRWPATERSTGAALHAKILVVDDEVALVGSANMTSRAMEQNLECGVMVRGHGAARAIRGHILRLRERGVLSAADLG